jgi:hypothetical protein
MSIGEILKIYKALRLLGENNKFNRERLTPFPYDDFKTSSQMGNQPITSTGTLYHFPINQAKARLDANSPIGTQACPIRPVPERCAARCPAAKVPPANGFTDDCCAEQDPAMQSCVTGQSW